MEKNEKAHILKNITRLIACTKDENAWFTQLLARDFVSTATWQKIKKEQHDTDSYVRELYMECMKTPNYMELINSLRDCGNDNAANILEEIGHPTSPTGASADAAPAVLTASPIDFPITEKHFVRISEILENVDELEQDWEAVLLNLKLSGKSKGEIRKLQNPNANFGGIILKTLRLWRSQFVNEATFEKLTNAVRSKPEAVAELKENREEIRNQN